MSVAFPTLNYTILRETQWETPVEVLADQTRCGRKKRRPTAQLTPPTFSVVLRFPTLQDKRIFETWFEEYLYHGALSFTHPKIDDTTGQMVEYAFKEGTSISWTNVSGHITQASMTWEEM